MTYRLKLRRGLLILAATGALVAGSGFGGAPAVASASPPTPACDITGTWFVVFAGTRLASQGVATVVIRNQHPIGNDQGSNDVDQPLVYGFVWDATFASNLATARGIGTLVVPANTSAVTFTLDGQGMHPLYGPFMLDAQGTGTCVAGKGTDATGTETLRFDRDKSMDQGTLFASRGGLPT